MAFVTQTRRSTAGDSLGQRLAAIRQDLSDRLARRRLYRRTVSELAALSDRDLADLGLHRASIEEVAYEAAYRA